MNVGNWIKLFEEVGVNKDTLDKWHRRFEEQYPEDHQTFLEWLGLDTEKIKKIRGV